MTTTFDHLTISDVLRHRVSADAGRSFLTYCDPQEPHTTRTWTYADCAADVAVTRQLLRTLGVRAGDRVVLHMENSPEFVVALLAIVGVDAVAVPTITQYAADELAFVVEHSECAAIVTNLRHQGMVERVAAAASIPPPVIRGTTVTNGRHRARLPSTRLPGDDGPPGRRTAVLMYTSGTTGRPKGVMLSHAACLAAGATTRNETGLRPDDRSYCVLPLFHVNAMCFQLLPTLLTGSHLVVGPGFSARAYWPVVAGQGITVGNLTAGPLRILLAAPASAADAATPMRLMMYALPLDRDEIRAVSSRFGVDVSMGWGLTESAACGTRTPLLLDPRHDWQSIGMVSPGWQLRVLDDDAADGTEARPGDVGELVIRGPSIMTGYFKDPEATREVLDDDGWLRTGDLGRLDDGYVFFHDRKKDVIKVKGENVGAGEVERVLLDHPQVEGCAAIGVPDPILGERLVVFVVPVAGTTPVAEALRAYCAERLAAFKVPSEVVPVNELPRTSIGKIRKAELRSQAASLLTGRTRP
ncbi:class I adenylate-forming enzyme family protein [Jiangella gansuensis]|uniref:class I adenylate-forming enzyme family protein n=1 Tax=Jiangella gansuensis TaxID=281473 RepID=UPI0004BA75D7|nr:class I adenylate-forming enzyme family protein [Jiangella gansuensis]